MASPAEVSAFNEAIFDQLATPGMEKACADNISEFTRTRVREDGFYRRIIPAVQVNNDDLDRQVDTDKPVKVTLGMGALRVRPAE